MAAGKIHSNIPEAVKQASEKGVNSEQRRGRKDTKQPVGMYGPTIGKREAPTPVDDSFDTIRRTEPRLRGALHVRKR